MAMNIKNPKTEKLARELAERTGESLTEAVTVALAERLGRLGEPEDRAAKRYSAIMRIADDCAARVRPVLGSQDVDAYLYDPESGLPRED